MVSLSDLKECEKYMFWNDLVNVSAVYIYVIINVHNSQQVKIPKCHFGPTYIHQTNFGSFQVRPGVSGDADKPMHMSHVQQNTTLKINHVTVTGTAKDTLTAQTAYPAVPFYIDLTS